MIIPPDPEKDPHIFTATNSTPSLLLPPTESSSSIQSPETAHLRNPSFGYPFGDDRSVLQVDMGENGEALPPYEGRRRRLRQDIPLSRERDLQRPGIVIPPRPRSSDSINSITLNTPINTTSLPSLSAQLNQPNQAISPSSTTKLWESSSFPSSSPQRPSIFSKLCRPPLPPGFTKWWKRYRRYVQAALIFLFIGIGIMIGLLVASRKGIWARPPGQIPGGSQGMHDSSGDGSRTTSWSSVS